MTIEEAIIINQSKLMKMCNKCKTQTECKNCTKKEFYILVDDLLREKRK